MSLRLLLILIPINLFSQKYEIKYRTSRDSITSLHYITFHRDGTLTLTFPRGPGVYFIDQIEKPYIYSFSMKNDTIYIESSDTNKLHNDNIVIRRLINSRFVVRNKNELFDVISGFTYVNNRKISDKTIIVFEGKCYKTNKIGSFLLNQKIKNIKSEDLEMKILHGKECFDKYGIKGINAVIEIKRK